MLTIRLFCAGGMSTSLLVTKMRQAAEAEGIEVDIVAHGVGGCERHVDETTDVVMLGPQVGYREKEVRGKLEHFGIPIAVIPMQDYGMVNGKNVFALAKKLAIEAGRYSE